MDRLDDMALFLRVLDAGSITAAARDLDISVAMASQRLGRLEDALQARLLHRTTRRIAATDEGLIVAGRARALLDQFADLQSSVRAEGQSIAGTLRMTVSSTFGAMYLSPLIPKFLARHPDVRLSLNFTDAVVDFIESGIDLAIRIGDLPDSSLVATRLAPNQRVLVAAPSYLKHRGTPKSAGDLRDHDCLIHVNGRRRLDRWTLMPCAGGRRVEIEVAGRLESTQGEVLRDAAVRGMGIANHSWWHVAEDVKKNRLRVILPNYQLPSSAIHAVVPQRKFVPPRVHAMIDFLREEYANLPSYSPEP